MLGIWWQESEGAKFWLAVLNDLHRRGVEDVLIACVDGLKGFPEAIEAVFPQAWVQTCIVHQIRSQHALRHLPRPQDASPPTSSPSTAPINADAAAEQLAAFDERLGRALPDDRRVLASTLGAHHRRSSRCPPTCAARSTPPTASRTSTARSARRSRPADTSPTNKPPPSSSTSRSNAPTQMAPAYHWTAAPPPSRSTSETDSPTDINRPGLTHEARTVSLLLHGLSRGPRAARGAPNRYEWPCPGDLLTWTSPLRALRRPGPARPATAPARPPRMRPATASATTSCTRSSTTTHGWPTSSSATPKRRHRHRLPRARARLLRRRRHPRPTADDRQRVELRQTARCASCSPRASVRHLTTRPWRPRTNGKVERFLQTLGRESAYGRSYPTSTRRAGLLQDWLERYKHARPHSAIGGRTHQPRSQRL